jgi:hypothetical protein
MVHAAVHPHWDLETLARRAREAEARLGHPDRTVAKRLLASDPEADAALDALLLITNCRSVSSEGSWSNAEPVAPAVPWHVAWSLRAHPYGVVYGHWALQGLHVTPRLRGLDTGCVHHGRDHEGFLTAWVPSLAREDPFALPDREFWQIRAHRRYCREASPGKRPSVQ